MNKEELINRVHNSTNYTKKETRAIVNSTLDCIMDTLASNEQVTLHNFGTLSPNFKKERNTTHPQTHQLIVAKGHYTVKFEPGKKLKEMVNKIDLQS